MKYYISIMLFLILSASNAQTRFHGKYENAFGQEVKFDSNGTFEYNYHYWCMGMGFIRGKWTQKNDTIYFFKTSIFDTVRFENETQNSMDSLVLSTDEKAERISKEQYKEDFYAGGGQDTSLQITKLFYKNERLYCIKYNGKLITKKIKRYHYKKGSLRQHLYRIVNQRKYVPWYSKVTN